MLPSDTSALSQIEEETVIDVRRYLDLFRQWWWLIVLAALLAGTSAFLISSQITPIYKASTTLLINEAPSYKATDYNTILTSERLTRTYALMLVKRPVLEELAARLSLSETATQLSEAINVTPVRDTQLIVVNVEHSDPALAAAIANTLYQVFSEQIFETQNSRFAASKESLQNQITETEKEIANTRANLAVASSSADIDRLENRINQYETISANLTLRYEEVRMTEAQTTSNVLQVERAIAPEEPIRPRKLNNTLIATLVGLFLTCFGLIVFDMLDDTIKDPEVITRSFSLPILGMIAQDPELQTRETLVTHAQPRSPVSESFRSLRTNVQYASVDRPIRTLLVTSPAPGDGKSTVTANLAIVMAQMGRNISVIDADLHRPRVAQIFQAAKLPGLSALFVQPHVHLNGSLQTTVQSGLRVVSAGELPPNPSELLGSKRMREIVETVLAKSDMVILDTPPILAVTDAAVLSPIADGVLLVVRPGTTRLSALKAAVEQLRRVNAPLIGVVLNGVNPQHSRYSYYNAYNYQQPEQRPAVQIPAFLRFRNGTREKQLS